MARPSRGIKQVAPDGRRLRTPARTYFQVWDLACCTLEEFERWFRLMDCSAHLPCRTLEAFCHDCPLEYRREMINLNACALHQVRKTGKLPKKPIRPPWHREKRK